ncbi:IclR family transcriptional regulator [Pandoraea pnomenusa]|uniref:IclR family transcriptional regulator n=1 Tax=Pandoraea pnomenusa TaxID=93220 RepID=UPI001CB97D0F|nr:IclR family transcriptional regulator [Pandoraea pnomenusa]
MNTKPDPAGTPDATDDKRDDEGGVRPLSSALKTLEVLDALGESVSPMRLVDLTRVVGASRATVYQRLLTLVRAGWVELTHDGAYRLSLHAARVGDAALAHASLGDRAEAVLRALADTTGETASLAVVDDGSIRIARRAEPHGVLKAELRVGAVLTLDGSASGRILAAFLPQTTLETLLRNGGTLADPHVIEAARATGYATSSQRDMPDVMAVAVPVDDAQQQCYAALSLVGPVSRFDAQALLGPLREAAAALTAMHHRQHIGIRR